MSTKGGYVEILEISQRHFELHILFYQSDQKDEKQAKYLYENLSGSVDYGFILYLNDCPFLYIINNCWSYRWSGWRKIIYDKSRYKRIT